jgi:dUTPase
MFSNDFYIHKGDKIAQIMLCPHKTYLFGIESEDERTGGFGSTDRDKEDS